MVREHGALLGRVFTAVPAAGSGVRMGLGYSKAFVDMEGLPLLSRTLEALLRDSESLSLVFLCNAAAITEMRRTLRVEGRDAAVERTSEVLKNHLEFLHGLSEKFTGST